MLLKRTAEQVMQDAMNRLAAQTPITNFKAGAIARALLEALKDEFPLLYNFGEEVLDMGFISKAKNEYLDFIGALFSYPRRLETYLDPQTSLTQTRLIDDEKYRYEISQRVLTVANANYEALRLCALAVPGVDDVIGKEYSHGTGSFSFYVVVSNGFNAEAVRQSVEQALKKTKAYGVRPNIILPKPIPMSMKLQLQFHESLPVTDRDRLRFEVKTAVYNYIGNLAMGQGFIYNELVKTVMDVHAKIIDFTVLQFYLNNEPTLLTNQNVYDDERIVIESVDVY